MSADVQALLREGELDQAIAALNGEVRANPSDVGRRSALAEALCMAGNLERADTILDSISTLDMTAAMGVALFRQLVRAEQARQQFYAEGRVPEFLAKPGPLLELELRASVALREGALREGAALLAERDEKRPAYAGTADGAAFDDFRDLDDLAAAHLEVLTSTGKYFWIAVENIGSISLRPIERRRDLLWRRAQLSVLGGPDGEVYLPAIYASKDPSAVQRLGHTTDFTGEDAGLALGAGLRSFLVGDDSRTLLELTEVEFAAPVAVD
jgi:type VI secretion system protein ImpE